MFPGARGFSGSMSEVFPDPFRDVASVNMPQSMRSALYLCEFICSSLGTYRMAMNRIASYFLTDLEFPADDLDDEELEDRRTFLTNNIGIMTELQNVLIDKMVYGNSFTSMVVPFKRFLTCPKCSLLLALNVIFNTPAFHFSWADHAFHANCPTCSYHGEWKITDRPGDNDSDLKIKRWSPHEIELLHDYYTDNCAYLWRIPEDYKQQVRRGTLWHLERCPEPVLKAIKKNQMFRFNQGEIFHMKEPTLAGIRNRGWGLPRTLTNFRQIYYVQVLRRFNEAIALDYVIPFRILTPAMRTGGGGGSGGAMQTADPLLAFNMSDFRSQAMAMIRRRRRDPAAMQVFPFPVQYQVLGGEANKLAPVDLIANGTEQLLNDIGTPVELYKGTLQLQAAPVALRLFESTWAPMVADANSFLRWVDRQLSRIMKHEPSPPSLRRVTIADDAAKTMAMLQLFSGSQISGEDALKTLGLSYKAQVKKISDEAIFAAEIQAKAQEKLTQEGFASELAKGQPGGQGGSGAQGGAPAGGGGGGSQQPAPMPSAVDQYLASQNPGVPQTPENQVQAATAIANALIGVDELSKNMQLKKLRMHNSVMHSLVLSRIKKIRQDAKNRGGQQLLAQQSQGQGGGQ